MKEAYIWLKNIIGVIFKGISGYARLLENIEWIGRAIACFFIRIGRYVFQDLYSP